MTPGAAPVAAPPAPTGPTDVDVDKLRQFTARADVPEQAKREAVAAFARTYPSTVPAQPPATPADEGALQATPARGVVRGMFPEGGALGMVGDVVTNPTEVGGMAGATLGTLAASSLYPAVALAPETMGASLLLPAMLAGGAMLGGYFGREAGASVESPAPGGALVAPGQGRTRSSTERFIGAAVDALPVVVGNWLKPKIMTGPEVEAAVNALTAGKALGKKGAERLPAGAQALAEERLAAVPKPTAEALPPRPGRAPTAPGTAPIPEVAPGVPAGAMSPLPPDVPPTIGPQFTRVAQEHLKVVEKQKAAHYGAELAKAKELGLEGPPPQHIMRAAGDALEALDRSGLDPTVRDGARKVLESVRDLDVGRLGRRTTIGEGGRIEGAVTKEPLEGPVTYADYDAWRQKLQEYAPGFAKLGQAQSQSKGSVGHVLGLIDEEMGQLARGTDVETLHRAADDFFVHEVQPARAVAKQVLRGEIEPNTLVDALTGKAHQQKFARYLKQLDDTAPGQARAFRQVKTQNMIERASRSGTFDPEAFLAEFNKMPTRTRDALMHGTPARELRELFGNIDQAKALARTAQADTQAALDAAHADALAGHEAAAADYAAAVAKGKDTATVYRTAREHAKAQDPVLVSARRKLASQQMLMEAPADVLGGVLGLKAVMQTGNVYPLFNWLGGGSGVAAAHRLMSTILSTPNAPRALNRLFRLAASGASESAKARAGAQLVAHLAEGTGREIMNR